MGSNRNWKSFVAAAVACGVLGFAADAEPGCEGPLWGAGSVANDIVNGVLTSTRWDLDGPGPESEWLVIAGTPDLSGTGLTGSVVAWDGQRFRSVGDSAGLGRNTISTISTWNGRLVAALYAANKPQILVLNDGI